MSHELLLPIVLPLLTGALLLAQARRSLAFKRALSLGACLLLSATAIFLLRLASQGETLSYALGGWAPPFGIVLVLDRLAALMLLVTSLLALASMLYASAGEDAPGRNFHALFQFQLLGLNGAFLTGDVFNLFVFFEIMLIASYGLLLQHGRPDRSRAGLHYVVLNLAGSLLFLIAVGILYGVLGTLNLADLAVKAAQVKPADAPLVRSAALLLLVVFSLKAALVPLQFWLPPAYASAPAPVAALFAVLTKVGVYAIVRIYTLVFGPGAGAVAQVALPWVLPAALATLVVGTAGVLASRDLRTLVAYLVVMSLGTLFAGIGLFSVEGLAAALYYLVHTTLVTGGLFLLVDLIARQRDRADRLEAGGRVAQPALLGSLFLVGAVAVVGLPPLSGLVGKLLILKAGLGSPLMTWTWTIILLSGLAGIITLSRAGSLLFWKTGPAASAAPGAPGWAWLPVAALLAASPLLVLLAGPLTEFTRDVALQLMDTGNYLAGVLR